MSTAALTLFDAGGRSAIFSPCRTWRYELRRTWQPARPAAMFVGLNPSTADELEDDNTVKRRMAYARQWGYGGLIMTNLFGYRATDPREMKAHPDPIGPENDAHLQFLAAEAGIVIAAWGTHGTHRGRAREILSAELLGDYRVLALTASGEPWHPLYLKRELEPITPDEAKRRRDTAARAAPPPRASRDHRALRAAVLAGACSAGAGLCAPSSSLGRCWPTPPTAARDCREGHRADHHRARHRPQGELRVRARTPRTRDRARERPPVHRALRRRRLWLLRVPRPPGGCPMIDPSPLTSLMIAVGRERYIAKRRGHHAIAVRMHPDTLAAMERLREACYPERTIDDVFELAFKSHDDVAPGSFRLELADTPGPVRAPSSPDGGPPVGPVTATLTEGAL